MSIPRQRITIMRRIETRNTVGELLQSFQPACRIWAEVGDGMATARYFGECFPGWRAVIDGREMEITGVVDRQFRGGRLVELQVREISGHRRFCPVRFVDEQPSSRAFHGSAANTSKQGQRKWI